jgi:predicted transcriptional regulator of viral defense system
MSYQVKLERLIEDRDGLILTKEVVAAGVPRQYLNIFVRENRLERVAHGVYLTPDTFDDEMYRLQARNQRTIFSHETALYLHDLTDRDPIEWSVTVPYGYNATHLRAEGVKVYAVKKALHQMGVMELKTIYGRPIKAYNKERTICDIIRNRARYYAYGILGRNLSMEQPFELDEDFVYWHPCDNVPANIESYGYWILTIDPKTGDAVKCK